MSTLTPVICRPIFQDYIWGGWQLRDRLNKKSDQKLACMAESWELSTHEHGQSLIDNGDFAGQTFAHYLQKMGPQVLSDHYQDSDLNILIKFLDVRDTLSVQVHPDDAYARAQGFPHGKTEMWYIVDAQPEAYIYYGFKKPVTKEELAASLRDNSIEQLLQKIPVKAGDFVLINAGTLHAAANGCLIAEIQQNCDLTYRVYDYNRRGADGQLRPLHIQQALDVATLEPVPMASAQPIIDLSAHNTCQVLTSCPYFTVAKLTLADPYQSHVTPDTCQILMVIDGEFSLIHQEKTYQLPLGTTVFLPAKMGDYTLTGQGSALLVTEA